MSYYVYILLCADNTFYTGTTNNLERRMDEHSKSDYSSYVGRRKPFKLVFSEEFKYVLDAIAAEKQIKGWSRLKKIALIENDIALLKELSNRSLRQAQTDEL